MANASSKAVEDDNNNPVPPPTADDLKKSNLTVKCKPKEGDVIMVPASILRQSESFKELWTNSKMATASKEDLEKFEFPLENVAAATFEKMVEWMKEHENADEPGVAVVEQEGPDADAHQHEHEKRARLNLTPYEKAFFDVSVDELVILLQSSAFLNIKLMYRAACQSMCAIIRDKTVQELIVLFGLENDLTEEKKAESRELNTWALY